MKFSLKSVAILSAISSLAIAPVFLSAGAASAQPTGMNGSYLGAGVSAGLTSSENSDSTIGPAIQGRADITTAPVSIRAAALFGDNSAALVPIVSYDLAVGKNTNLYAGAGYSFVTNEGRETPLGNKNAPVLTAGVESEVAQHVVLFSDIKVGIDAYKNSSDSAVSLQVGAGYRF